MPSADVDSRDPIEDDISTKDLDALLKDIGATRESLKRDAATLREWVVAQQHLPNITSDEDEWLEMFIMASKNSMEKAKIRLDNYFTSRSTMADWFILPPPPEDRLIVEEAEHMLGGYLPKMLPGGDVLVIERVMVPADGTWSRFNMNYHFRRSLLNVETMMGRCKKTRGAVLILDQKNFNLNVVTTFLGHIGGFRRLISCIQDAMPMRVKAIHLVNTTAPNLQRMLLNAVTPLLKGKLAQRIMIHNDMKSLHEHISIEYLPEDYGGKIPMTVETMTCNLNNFIYSKGQWLASREWMKSNEDRRLTKKSPDFGVEGSFRKLTVD